MTGVLSSAVLPAEVAHRYPYGYAVVDVETSGLRAGSDRVLQVAVTQMAADGSIESNWSTLLDPGCDPGPTHIHGLTRAKLRGAPQYADVADDIARRVHGRIAVAHNADFDHRFLTAESKRAGRRLPVEERLCTLALTRRLDLPVADFKLGSVADYWGVRAVRAHDAEDDVRVLVEILRHSLVTAARLDMDLPLSACTDTAPAPFPAKAPRTPCPWRTPGPWTPGTPLVQGMKVVITGSTSIPREILTRRCTDAGLDVMNTVSGRTHLLVCNRVEEQTGKAARARQHGTPVITEPELVALLTAVSPGKPKVAETVTAGRTAVPAPRSPVPSGPLSGRRVVVLGGAHETAATIRERVLEAGASVAVNLTGSVTDVVLVPTPVPDPRTERARALGLRPLDADTLTPCLWPDNPAEIDTVPSVSHLPAAAPTQTIPATPHILVRGEVMDLPAPAEWLVEVRWALPGRTAADSYDIDVVAFVVDADEQVTVDEDFVFYNARVHPTGAVAVTGGIAGEAMCTLRPDRLPPTQRRVLLAAAIDDMATFGDVGPIELILRDQDGAPVARATLDAATDERSLILGTLYQRNGTWRWRAVGQGYPDDLADLAVRHGVDIEEQD
ncbi:DNA polymerase III [Geodermatophilus sabuli]|uniref:DNA polymerase III n=1 Tax=Geodermatophilus sabuli TaxID=1564158 RepID=A0A7K3W645_9ACTN|nr:TerD family protein [Geodermatophilus sabuli]NEK60241.1 DNA polymerase III [Geodermatophilus sabuli]